MLLTAWGTANMRTGGDDIAQCLALMGVKPQWDSASRRVTGFEIIPSSALGRPRVDVTLRISGFFRDAFPAQIALVDSAARAVMALDESADINPAADRAKAEHSTARVFGSKPGAYGAGLQAMIDERLWADKKDLAEAYLEWGSYAYGSGADGQKNRQAFETRLRQAEAIVQNQDNREHDVLDSDDYYQFEGGAAAAVATLQGRSARSTTMTIRALNVRSSARWTTKSGGSFDRARSTRNGSPGLSATATRAPSKLLPQSTISSPLPQPQAPCAVIISTSSTPLFLRMRKHAHSSPRPMRRR